MLRRSRVLLVDGPDDGVSFNVEGIPPDKWLTPGMVAMRTYREGNNLGETMPLHIYRPAFTTRQGTHIYVWIGQEEPRG